MSGENKRAEEKRLRDAVAGLQKIAPGTIGDQLGFSLVEQREEEYTFRCRTETWMANAAGTLHGGIAAAVVDQAMGFVVYAIQPGEGFSPTVEMQLSYHRPLRPQGELLVRVRVMSRGKSLMHLRAELFMEDAPEKLCVSATAVYALVPAKQ